MTEEYRVGRPMGGLYKRLFARCYDGFMQEYEEYIASHKQALFADISGTVLEIGPGTGANLRYIPKDSRWIGVEPNPHMHEYLRRKAREAEIEPELHVTGADGFDIDDAVADVAISTLVLCSVPNVEQALREVRRVLKPGGRFLFIEHVAARQGSGLRFVQSSLFPFWYLFGDGCRINRDTGQSIREAGFDSVEIEEFRVPKRKVPAWVTPHIRGLATR